MQPVRSGDAGPAVAEVRAMLRAVGLLDPAANNGERYDDLTERAVRAFQQDRGLACDGVVGMETWRALEEARWSLGDRTLYYQPSRLIRGDDVVMLQSRLESLGFDVGRLDGIFGPRTDQALREFQLNVGMPGDGTCGAATLRALDALRRTVTGGRPGHLREHEALQRTGRTVAGRVVIVDPGHGGDDPGWVNGALREADIAYDVAHRLEGRLQALGAEPFVTRGVGGQVDETERAMFANETGADVLLSLHCDGSADLRAHGVATYYFGSALGTSATGERLAELVQDELVARTDFANCRSHAKTWDLLRLTRMPAVQIELGYLTHPNDAARLADAGFRDTLAEAIAVGLHRLYAPDAYDTPQLELS